MDNISIFSLPAGASQKTGQLREEYLLSRHLLLLQRLLVMNSNWKDVLTYSQFQTLVKIARKSVDDAAGNRNFWNKFLRELSDTDSSIVLSFSNASQAERQKIIQFFRLTVNALPMSSKTTENQGMLPNVIFTFATNVYSFSVGLSDKAAA